MLPAHTVTHWLTAAAFLLVWVLSAGADTIHVPDDYTLTDGIGHAAPGDTVLIAPGTYNEGHTLSLPSGITLMSESVEPSSVRFGGGNSRRVLLAESVTGVSLVGITIQFGGGDDTNYGAGLCCVDSELSLDHVTFLQNTSRRSGGGLYCTGSVVDLVDCSFDNNEVGTRDVTNGGWFYVGMGGGAYFGAGCTVTAERVAFSHNLTWSDGGAVYLDGPGTSVEMTDCAFANDRTYEPWGYLSPQYGGAIAAYEAQLTVRRVTFGGHSATTAGGAIFFLGGGPLTIDGCSFTGCECGGEGGALYTHFSTGLYVTDSLFTENIAGPTGGGAARVRCTGEPSEFTFCVFASNSSLGEGGAVKNWYGAADFTNCTFVGNSAPSGSQLVFRYGATGMVSNSILSSGLQGVPLACPEDGEPEVTHCYVFANAGGDSICGTAGENSFGDPLFCNAGGGDFSLCSNSTCLPDSNEWGELVGALGEGCGPCYSAFREASWGSIKAMFR